jgi:hypothetical protein
MSSERYPNCLELPYRSLCVEHKHVPISSCDQSVEALALLEIIREEQGPRIELSRSRIRQRGDILPVEYLEKAKAGPNA